MSYSVDKCFTVSSGFLNLVVILGDDVKQHGLELKNRIGVSVSKVFDGQNFSAKGLDVKTYVGVADLQNHDAQLTVLVLIQLMNQLSVITLYSNSIYDSSRLYLISGTYSISYCNNKQIKK